MFTQEQLTQFIAECTDINLLQEIEYLANERLEIINQYEKEEE